MNNEAIVHKVRRAVRPLEGAQAGLHLRAVSLARPQHFAVRQHWRGVDRGFVSAAIVQEEPVVVLSATG